MKAFIAALLTFIAILVIDQKVKSKDQFTIPGKTFDLDVVVVISKDTQKSLEMIRAIDTTATIADFDARGVTFTAGSSIVIWMPEVEDQIVSHELLHATVAIMNWAGVPLTEDTEEVYAYQLQYLTNEFYKNVNQ